jgi:oligoendopeptidase F
MRNGIALTFFLPCMIPLPPLRAAIRENKVEKRIPPYSLQERREVPPECTWKIEDLYASESGWQADKQSMARDGYLKLLKAGGSDCPLSILKKASVDMFKPDPYITALKRFDQLVGEMERIVARLEKQKKF